jgi:hypothetical protein
MNVNVENQSDIKIAPNVLNGPASNKKYIGGNQLNE